MRQQWTSETECTLDGVPIHTVQSDDLTQHTTDERIVVLKGQGFFKSYANLTRNHTIRRILEVGVFEGGSALLLADMFPEARIVGVDIRPENPAVKRLAKRFGFDNRLTIHYETPQDNTARLAEIIKDELGGEIDFVCDDASHFYAETRKTFETVFPLLRPGGLYVIEDWAWSHWPGETFAGWPSPVMANLIFELVLASAAKRDLVAEVSANAAFSVIHRGTLPARDPIDIDAIIRKDNRTWTRL